MEKGATYLSFGGRTVAENLADAVAKKNLVALPNGKPLHRHAVTYPVEEPADKNIR